MLKPLVRIDTAVSLEAQVYETVQFRWCVISREMVWRYEYSTDAIWGRVVVFLKSVFPLQHGEAEKPLKICP